MLTPEERAYQDMLAEAVEMGVYGEEALEYADRMRDTLAFQMLTLHHAGVDVGRAFKAEASSVAERLRAIVTRRP